MHGRVLSFSILALSASSSLLAADSGITYVPAPAPVGNAPPAPFSEGISVNGTFYVAGHVGLDPATQKASVNADAEAHAVLDAVKHTLEEGGLTMDDLVSVTVYCTDLSLYDGFNAIYRTYFRNHYPTRAFIGVNQLVRGAHFEISGIAAVARKK